MPEAKDKTEKASGESNRVQPVTVLEVVEAIPEGPPSGNRRVLYDALTTVATEYKGSAVKVMHYASDEGAQQVARKIAKGDRAMPGGGKPDAEGNIAGWTVEARRTGKVGEGSDLYAKYDGPDITPDDADESAA